MAMAAQSPPVRLQGHGLKFPVGTIFLAPNPLLSMPAFWWGSPGALCLGSQACSCGVPCGVMASFPGTEEAAGHPHPGKRDADPQGSSVLHTGVLTPAFLGVGLAPRGEMGKVAKSQASWTPSTHVGDPEVFGSGSAGSDSYGHLGNESADRRSFSLCLLLPVNLPLQ